MKQGWEIKKLGEVFDLQMGKTPSRDNGDYWGGNNVWVAISDLQDKYIGESKEHITDKALTETKIKKVKAGTTIMSFKLSVGRAAITTQDLYTNEAIMAFNLNEGYDLIADYIYYYLKGYKWQGANKAVMGLTLNKASISQNHIAIPPREEQERIVEELDCLSGVIEKKREQLKQLDALAQSIFYQMFGDPITNEKGWEENIIGNLAEFYNGVAHEGSISEDGQYDVINSKFISTQGEIRKHCDSQIFPLMKNDIVMVMSDVRNGKALAKCYLIETSDKYTLNQRICAFRNYNCFKPIFLYYYLNRHPYYLRFDDGNGQTNLRRNDVLNCPVYIPPLALQQEFADKIEAIEKQKELIKKSISETETLFNARMDYYFN